MKRNIFSILFVFISIMINAQVTQLLNDVKKEKAPDTRVSIWDISSELENGIYNISGKVDNPDAKKAIDEALTAKGIKFINNVVVLPDADIDKTWALTTLPIAHLRTKPGHEQELTSQTIMGTPLRILEKKEYWYRVQTPDNYISWIIGTGIKRMSEAELANWKKSTRYIVIKNQSSLISNPDKKESLISELVMGDILEVDKKNNNVVNNMICLKIPDGRSGYINLADVKELSSWANQSYNPDLILNTAHSLMGSCYTWGGTSPKGVDCSGLTKICYFANGIILQRDASQQALYGTKISPDDWNKSKKGDLLFFGSTKNKVTHVGIYMQNGDYIHSSGQVKVNSLNPKSINYLTTPLITISGIDGNIDTKGIVSVKNHPWYF